jgi:hypothetical protein
MVQLIILFEPDRPTREEEEFEKFPIEVLPNLLLRRNRLKLLLRPPVTAVSEVVRKAWDLTLEEVNDQDQLVGIL